MKNYRLRTLLVIVVAVYFAGVTTGCNNTVDGMVEDKTRTGKSDVLATKRVNPALSPEEAAKLNAQLEEIARATAAALGDEQTATWLYNKCSERFDGCANVLWRQISKEKNVPANVAKGKNAVHKDWSEMILASHRGAENKVFSSKQTLNEAIWSISEAMGGHTHLWWDRPELWDKKTAPLVGFTPVDVDNDHIKELDAFDADGNRYKINAKTALTRPVVIITKNERVTRDGKLKRAYYKGNGNGSDRIQIEDDPGDPTGGSNGGQAGNPNFPLFVQSVKFNDSFDSWPGADPEFYFIIDANPNQISKQYISMSSGECNVNSGWKYLGIYTNWPAGHSDIFVKWYEEDDWFNWGDDKLADHYLNILTSWAEITLGNGAAYNPGARYSW